VRCTCCPNSQGYEIEYCSCDTCGRTGQLTLEEFDNLTKQRAEAQRRYAEEQKHRTEEEARRKAEEQKRQAEEQQRRAEAEVKRRAEEEKGRAEEHARWLADEPKRRAEAEKRRQEEERRRAEEEKRCAEEQQRRVEEEARQKAEEQKRRKEEEARRRAAKLKQKLGRVARFAVVIAVGFWLLRAGGLAWLSSQWRAFASNSHSTSVSNAGLFAPYTQSRKVTSADLKGKTAFQLDVMRNEIYARHGFKFGSKRRKDLANYFGSKAWYRPNTDDQNVAYSRFNPTERYNVRFIREYQLARGRMKGRK